MKVERHVQTHEEERTRISRPSGKTISYSQLNTPCDLRLKFRRMRLKVQNPLGISLSYGRAAHGGMEAFLRGAARTPQQALLAATAILTEELAKNQRNGIRWDAYHERNQDGSISQTGSNFGSLPDVDFCRFWLVRQVALWLLLYGDLKVRHSEKAIFIPLAKLPHWTSEWSIECWLDFIVEGPAGYRLVDFKTSSKGWDERDLQKSSKQALLYMAAYAQELYAAATAGYDISPDQRLRWRAGMAAWEPIPSTLPVAPFEFHVMPRTRAALPALEIAYAWAKGELDRVEALTLLNAGGPVKTTVATKATKASKTRAAVAAVTAPVLDAEGQQVQEWTVKDAMEVWSVAYDAKKINTYLNGVVRPRINVIEAEAFAANPSGWWCAPSYCDYWVHCAFGEGTAL